VIKLSFIGMSGAGKSFWSRKLASAGFRAISIDDRIEEKLAPELEAGGHKGIGGVAEWMGWPDQPAYREREQKYLASEIGAMREALDEIATSSGEGTVLDTTGSVIYSGEDTCRRLKNLTKVIYFAASPNEEETLIARYLSDPKPVLWSDVFAPRPGESARDAVERCYPLLIAKRKNQYERLADCTVPMSQLRDGALDARGFLELLEAQVRPTR
jgi:shikimate kinase